MKIPERLPTFAKEKQATMYVKSILLSILGTSCDKDVLLIENDVIQIHSGS